MDELLFELLCWRRDGVTEAMLRAHDGYIKVGHGCLLVQDPNWKQPEQARLL